MDVLLGAIIGAGAAIVTSALTTWAGLQVQRNQVSGALQLHLFEKRLDAHAAVARQLLALRFEMMRVLATATVAPDRRAEAAKVLNERGLETMVALDEHNFYLDRLASEAVWTFVALANQVRDGESPTQEVIGQAYGAVISTLQQVMAIPELANETYRRAQPKPPRRWPWRRRHRPPPPDR